MKDIEQPGRRCIHCNGVFQKRKDIEGFIGVCAKYNVLVSDSLCGCTGDSDGQVTLWNFSGSPPEQYVPEGGDTEMLPALAACKDVYGYKRCVNCKSFFQQTKGFPGFIGICTRHGRKVTDSLCGCRQDPNGAIAIMNFCDL